VLLLCAAAYCCGLRCRCPVTATMPLRGDLGPPRAVAGCRGPRTGVTPMARETVRYRCQPVVRRLLRA